MKAMPKIKFSEKHKDRVEIISCERMEVGYTDGTAKATGTNCKIEVITGQNKKKKK